MSLARLVITAVSVEGRSKSAVAREYGLSRFWVQQLVHRYQREGPAAFESRSRGRTPTRGRWIWRWRIGSSGCVRH
jgi:transposase